MKRTCFFSAFLFAVIMLGTVFANQVYAQTPTKTTTSNEKSEAVQPSLFPNDVTVVFKNSCMVCHGTGGRLLTLSVLDLSKWDKYDVGKKAKKAAAICDRVTKGVMPPLSFQRANPTSVLTPTQKELICNWSKTQIPEKNTPIR